MHKITHLTHTNVNDSSELSGLANYLYQDKLLSLTTIYHAINSAEKQGIALTTFLVHSNLISSEDILSCCIKHFNLPFFELENYDVNILQKNLIQFPLMLRYRIIPIKQEQHALSLGMVDPTDYTAISVIGFHTGLQIHPMLVSEIALEKILTAYNHKNQLHSQLESTLAKITPIEDTLSTHTFQEDDDGPISKLIENLLSDAVTKQVSDIHIEPFANHCRIRFRRDGLLYEAANIPNYLTSRLISRLKIIANLNIAERRLPQDGRFQLQQNATDIRINTCPNLFGEKIVLRIGTHNLKLSIDQLGFTDIQKKIFFSSLTCPQGLILVTGPTGSGKTITLYSALNYLNQIEKNILTVEDPIEIDFPGINQVNVHPQIGWDFAKALRTFLRQDPDIIMIGEIRDSETAIIAMQAAQTGHLVLSTLHTNSAIDTLIRLRSMGIATHFFLHSLSLIIAQRLMRKLCQFCKAPGLFPTEIIEKHKHLADVLIYTAVGCNQCNDGYQGRIGIFELIPINEDMSQHIIAMENPTTIMNIIQKNQWILLWDAGIEKIIHGLTTYTELIRILGNPYYS